MAGTLRLYYDTADGERVDLAGWDISLGPDAWRDLPPIPPPLPNKPPAEPGRYLAVFRGPLGGEPDAVVAKWMTVSVGYVRVLGLSQSCTRQDSNLLSCEDTLSATGRSVLPQPDDTVEFAGDDTFAYHFISHTIGPPLYPDDGPGPYLNAEEAVQRVLYLFREDGDSVAQVTVAMAGFGFACWIDWGTLRGPVEGLATSTYFEEPEFAEPRGGTFFGANGTYSFAVGPGPLLFRVFRTAQLIQPIPAPVGTYSADARCDLTRIRFLPE